MTNPKTNLGFTLIELMIVVAIVAILSRIAFPSYQAYIQRGYRAEARAAMLNMAQLEERNYTDRGSYIAISSGDLSSSSTISAWAAANWSGSNFSSRKYDITVALNVTVGTTTYPYMITATANGWTDSSCGNLTLASDGTKGSSLGDAASCWK